MLGHRPPHPGAPRLRFVYTLVRFAKAKTLFSSNPLRLLQYCTGWYIVAVLHTGACDVWHTACTVFSVVHGGQPTLATAAMAPGRHLY